MIKQKTKMDLIEMMERANRLLNKTNFISDSELGEKLNNEANDAFIKYGAESNDFIDKVEKIYDEYKKMNKVS